jgi:hypothetical protein
MNYERFNAKTGRHMRVCETCGAGIGIMTQKEFAKFVNSSGICPVCNKPVINHTEDSEWISLQDAHERYKVSIYVLRHDVRVHKLSSRLEHGMILISARELNQYAERGSNA